MWSGVTALPNLTQEKENEETMTYYIAAYDTESPACLKACRKIVDVHRQDEMPATFFIVGRTLESNPTEYRELLDDPLFEVASHTYSHKMLRDHPFCGLAVTAEQKREEIFRGKASIERVFERPCLGLRPGCGFDKGMEGAPDVLRLISEADLHYVSSLLWGPDYSLPALLIEPFNYASDGFPELWELPGHGWQENLLKNNNRWGSRRLTLWPAKIPEAIPTSFISTPEEEFAINRIFLEKAVSEDKTFVSIIWHPWSLDAFDPEMKMLELTFTNVRKLGLEPCTYVDLFRKVSDS
jgi:hypothetical protein